MYLISFPVVRTCNAVLCLFFKVPKHLLHIFSFLIAHSRGTHLVPVIRSHSEVVVPRYAPKMFRSIQSDQRFLLQFLLVVLGSSPPFILKYIDNHWEFFNVIDKHHSSSACHDPLSSLKLVGCVFRRPWL